MRDEDGPLYPADVLTTWLIMTLCTLLTSALVYAIYCGVRALLQ